jgi:hypothetical protein
MALASLNPSLLVAFAYVGGAAFAASIVGWLLGALFAPRNALDWAQHSGYGAGYFATLVVVAVWFWRAF